MENREIAMRKPFKIALMIALSSFLGVFALAFIFSSEPIHPDPLFAIVPILLIVNYCLSWIASMVIQQVVPQNTIIGTEPDNIHEPKNIKPRAINIPILTLIAVMTVLFMVLSQAPDGFPGNFFLFFLGFTIAGGVVPLLMNMQLIIIFMLLKSIHNNARNKLPLFKAGENNSSDEKAKISSTFLKWPIWIRAITTVIIIIFTPQIFSTGYTAGIIFVGIIFDRLMKGRIPIQNLKPSNCLG